MGYLFSVGEMIHAETLFAEVYDYKRYTGSMLECAIVERDERATTLSIAAKGKRCADIGQETRVCVFFDFYTTNLSHRNDFWMPSVSILWYDRGTYMGHVAWATGEQLGTGPIGHEVSRMQCVLK